MRTARWLALLALCACGKEVHRAGFTAEGSSSGTATLSAGEVAFWADLDIGWEDPATLRYTVELEQGGKLVATATCDPLGYMSTKLSWWQTQDGSSRTRRGMGKMDCSATLPAAGETTVRTTLAWSQRPAKLDLRKADLVLKQ